MGFRGSLHLQRRRAGTRDSGSIVASISGDGERRED
jgi:hypothetical protein